MVRSVLKKFFKYQTEENRKFVAQNREVNLQNVFGRIAPVYYDQFFELLEEASLVEEFINNLTIDQKQMLISYLPNENLKKCLCMNLIKLAEIPNERLQSFMALMSNDFFVILWDKLPLKDIIRLLIISLSTSSWRNFLLEDMGICPDKVSCKLIVDFMQKLNSIARLTEDANEALEYAKHEEMIYSLMVRALSPVVIAEMIAVDEYFSFTEKIVPLLTSNQKLVSVFDEIGPKNRIDVLTKCDFCIMKPLKGNYDWFEAFKSDDILQIVSLANEKHIRICELFKAEEIIKIYSLLDDDGDKKIILKEALSDYPVSYVELYDSLLKTERLQMLEFLIEIPLTALAKKEIISRLRNGDGIFEQLALEQLEKQ